MNGAEYTASDGLLLLLLLFPADLLRILTESPPEPKMSWKMKSMGIP